MKINSVLSILFLFIHLFIYSQEITGVVLDKKDNNPIANAAVYFDNTTKGVITNSKGFFSIEYQAGITTPLVVSYLGYKNIVLEKYEANKHYKVLLEEDESILNEVVLVSKNNWPREKKLTYFKTQFLGKTKNGKSCKILNEDDIKLWYNKKENKLTARANKPIVIENKNLGYKIQYNLQDFEIDFIAYKIKKNEFSKAYKNKYVIKSVSYSGTSLYKNLETSLDKKIIKKRHKTYNGSVLHFMRSIANNKLFAEDFKLFKGSFQINPPDYLLVEKQASITKVELTERLEILHKNEQSFFIPNSNHFIIDVLGNYSPVNSILFGGEMSKKRIGDTLPLDFTPKK